MPASTDTQDSNSLFSSSSDTPNDTGRDAQAPAGTVPPVRQLETQFQKRQLIQQDDGSLLIKDVPLLAEGTWTDSAQQTPLRYTARALEAYATNWIDRTGWSRHLGGVPRGLDEQVSEALNPHYGQFTAKDGTVHNAILSDILVHGRNQKSRDLIEMTRNGLIKAVSVEHTGDEKYNPSTREMESETLTFYGFAHVHRGACKLCKLNEERTPSAPADPPQEPPKDNPQDSTMTPEDKKALEEMLAAQATAHAEQIKALEAKLQPPEKKTAEKSDEVKALEKALADKDAEHKKALADMQASMDARIKALEQDGDSKTKQTPPAELSEPVGAGLIIDRKTGTIRRV